MHDCVILLIFFFHFYLMKISDSKAYDKLNEIITKPFLLKDVKKLSPAKQTSKVESYHGVIVCFAPKLLAFSYQGMKCRWEQKRYLQPENVVYTCMCINRLQLPCMQTYENHMLTASKLTCCISDSCLLVNISSVDSHENTNGLLMYPTA